MLAKVAWRNIWRNRVRSLVVIIAIALGLWAGVFAGAFVQGMMVSRIDTLIKLEMSHFQLHEQGFRDELDTRLFMANGADIVAQLQAEPEVQAVSGRLLGQVMLGTASKTGGIKAIGVDPEAEAAVSGVAEKMIDGKWFEGVKRNPIVVSKRIADKYNVDVRSKVVLTLQDIDRNITAGSFRVVGIYETGNGMYDEANVFVRRDDLDGLMLTNGGLHEIAVFLNEHDSAEAMAAKYQQQYEQLEVLPWMDLALGTRMMMDMMDTYTLWIVGIILVALLFSIINTMLMAVLERVREIGMLMAVGMTKGRVFFMIMLETVFMAMVGCPVGLFVAWASINYFGEHGIDLGSQAAYSEVGFSNVIHPALDFASYYQVAIMVAVMAILAAVYPAIKALRLNPAEAIRKI